jgi:hypothetical protein
VLRLAFFGLLLALIVRLGLLPDVAEEIEDAVKVMTELQSKIKADVPVLSNPAKRLAGQLIGRHVTVFWKQLYGSGCQALEMPDQRSGKSHCQF